LGLFQPEYVVEEKFVLVIDGEAFQFLAGPVKHDPFQFTDFRRYAERTALIGHERYLPVS